MRSGGGRELYNNGLLLVAVVNHMRKLLQFEPLWQVFNLNRKMKAEKGIGRLYRCGHNYILLISIINEAETFINSDIVIAGRPGYFI